MAIVMSIKPEFCEKIFSGEKRFEVRKTIPKSLPTKVYVYKSGGGMVVGEFMARDTIDIPVLFVKNGIHLPTILKGTCLNHRQLLDYVENSECFYEIEIGDPVLYKTPIPLSEFGLKRPPVSWCYAKD